MKNVFKRNAWYIKVYNMLPEWLRPAYCFSARVQYNTTDYVHFVWKWKAMYVCLFAAVLLSVLAVAATYFNLVVGLSLLGVAVIVMLAACML